jgi:hypothetical protein
MKHLTPDELVDLVEGTLAAGRAAHVEQCADCRRLADQARSALAAAAEDGVPEPSPLFWEHFSARVRRAIEAEPMRRWSWGWLWRPAVGLPLAAGLVVAIAIAALWRPAPAPAPGGATAAVETPAAGAGDEVDLSADDASWDLVATIAGTLEWEAAEAAGFSAEPGAADRAILLLTREERVELGRLLSAEALKQPM